MHFKTNSPGSWSSFQYGQNRSPSLAWSAAGFAGWPAPLALGMCNRLHSSTHNSSRFFSLLQTIRPSPRPSVSTALASWLCPPTFPSSSRPPAPPHHSLEALFCASESSVCPWSKCKKWGPPDSFGHSAPARLVRWPERWWKSTSQPGPVRWPQMHWIWFR